MANTTNIIYFKPGDNIAPNATPSVSSGTPVAGYPAAYMTDFSDMNRAFPAKIAETTGSFKLAFGSTRAAQAFILWHNFDAGLACHLEGDNGGSITNLGAITIPAKRGDGYTVKVWLDLRTAAPTFDNYTLVVSGTNSVPLGVKMMLMSTVRQPIMQMDWGLVQTDIHGSILQRTDSNYTWAYDTLESSRVLQGSKRAWKDQDREDIREFFRSLGGSASISAVIPDPALNDVWIGRWGSGQGNDLQHVSLASTYSSKNVNSLTIAFEEASTGAPEWV